MPAILVVGGGVAGIAAALDLAKAGRTVHLVERQQHLGGQVARLDKLYPTDHCAFCPLWTEVKQCMQHPQITVHTQCRLRELRKEGGYYVAVLVAEPHLIDQERCIFCGRCLQACPEGKSVGEHFSVCHPIQAVWEHASPPSYKIDVSACNRCGHCQEVCPTGAIDLRRDEVEIMLRIDHVIWATGFKEADLSPLKEFGSGSHADIMTSMEFEAWIAEAGPNQGRIIRRSNGTVPRNIAFVLCVGSRDKRLLPYCSAVGCMRALKQARWVKKRNPNIACAIFYTDLRTVGKSFYEYALRAVGEGELELIRGRPGLILPLPERETIALKYENTLTQKREIRTYDVVVLNSGLELCPTEVNPAERTCSSKGNLQPRVSAGSGDKTLTCGFCTQPANVAESVIQASAAALKVAVKTRLKRE